MEEPTPAPAASDWPARSSADSQSHGGQLDRSIVTASGVYPGRVERGSVGPVG